MPRKRAQRQTKKEEGPSCRHHWIIDYTDEPTSKGVCRLCGAERIFENHVTLPAKGTERHGEARRPQAERERDFMVVGHQSIPD